MARMLPRICEEFLFPMTMRHVRRAMVVMGIALGTLMTSGCSNPISKFLFTNHENRNEAMSWEKKQERAEEQGHRAKYQATRSSDDLEWLMQNRIENGLTLTSVNNILGQKGKPADGGTGVSQAGGTSETKDGTYLYGPDDKGQTYQLTFRNSRLVEFNPTTAGSADSIAQMSHSKKETGRASLEEGAKKSAGE